MKADASDEQGKWALMGKKDVDLQQMLEETFSDLDRGLSNHHAVLQVEAVGRVSAVAQGIARVAGLTGVKAEELLHFENGVLGMAFNLDRSEVGVILLDRAETLCADSEVRPTGRVLDVPVGEALLGRVVDALGRPLDHKGPLPDGLRAPVEREAPPIMDRAPVTVPLQTGIKVIDALIPIGRGQRELILGDRQTGKTAIAMDTLIHQKGQGVIGIYCAIGKRGSALAKVLATLKKQGVMGETVVVATTGEDPPGLQFVAPYAATTMAEYFMEQGRDVLIIYDDLTEHARAYRQLSLLLRRPPGREAFPGDIFYIHSRLLERATHLRPELGGGSLTALPILETEAQNIAAFIPTNLVSITDGQIYCSPDLFQKGQLPAVDVGKSVSRVGGKTQLPAYRAVAGDLRLSYAQFEELEAFSRFGTRLDEATRKTLAHGSRVREVLKQAQYASLSVPEQIAVLVAVNRGLLDEVPLEYIQEAEQEICRAVRENQEEAGKCILAGQALSEVDQDALLSTAKPTLERLKKQNGGEKDTQKDKTSSHP